MYQHGTWNTIHIQILFEHMNDFFKKNLKKDCEICEYKYIFLLIFGSSEHLMQQKENQLKKWIKNILQ